ncbi:hypothetical protein I5Q34_31755 [Streptomyces sp. AV19]|uniref:hypothetical protein n=1 Tax=Streptomyces sp. AV19 TaxID=2793068 RepID=UPI0018FE6060|nr:hypothetical protein [Streptomyces sp. AV19]MBH1938783.1 hypothetical protein [Streptomyces sp. AV19]MDG4534716.1 hypothetical protein [Streptomyces sp. AV19]
MAHDTAHQWGPRRLYDEVADAMAWWEEEGRPEILDFGPTVTEAGRTVWLKGEGSHVGRVD